MKELTGKAKEAFEGWVHDNLLMDLFCIKEYTEDGINYKEVDIHHLPETMQWGVLVDFFESVGVYVGVKWNVVIERFNTTVWVDLNEHWEVNSLVERSEARRAAIEKATQIFNER